jgi:hypothetical protein
MFGSMGDGKVGRGCGEFLGRYLGGVVWVVE